MLVWGCGHFCDCFDHGWRWANSLWAELEPHEHYFLDFKNPLGWIQLELYFAHTYQEMVQILIMIFLSLLLCFSTPVNEDIICNVADPFQVLQGPLVVLLDTPQVHLRLHMQPTATGVKRVKGNRAGRGKHATGFTL